MVNNDRDLNGMGKWEQYLRASCARNPIKLSSDIGLNLQVIRRKQQYVYKLERYCIRFSNNCKNGTILIGLLSVFLIWQQYYGS